MDACSGGFPSKRQFREVCLSEKFGVHLPLDFSNVRLQFTQFNANQGHAIV